MTSSGWEALGLFTTKAVASRLMLFGHLRPRERLIGTFDVLGPDENQRCNQTAAPC